MRESGAACRGGPLPRRAAARGGVPTDGPRGAAPWIPKRASDMRAGGVRRGDGPLFSKKAPFFKKQISIFWSEITPGSGQACHNSNNETVDSGPQISREVVSDMSPGNRGEGSRSEYVPEEWVKKTAHFLKQYEENGVLTSEIKKRRRRQAPEERDAPVCVVQQDRVVQGDHDRCPPVVLLGAAEKSEKG